MDGKLAQAQKHLSRKTNGSSSSEKQRLNAEVYVGSLNKQLAYGKELIILLKKQYHLD